MALIASPFRYALATNSTATAFVAQTPTTTEPSGVGIFDLTKPDHGGFELGVPEYIQLIPFGTNGNNDTFDMRLWGISKIASADIWVPQLLVDLSVVLGDIAASDIAANTFLADTLTVNDGAADNGPWRSIIDAQEDLVASIMVHTRGCRYIKFDWDLAGGQEAVSMNCLWRGVGERHI